MGLPVPQTSTVLDEPLVPLLRADKLYVLASSLDSCLENYRPETAEIVKPFSHFFSPFVFKVKEPCNHANILTKPDPRTFWTNDDSGIIGKIYFGPVICKKHSLVKPYTKAKVGGNICFCLFVCLFIPHPTLEYTSQ